VVIVEPPSYLHKQSDGVTGLALIAIDSSDGADTLSRRAGALAAVMAVLRRHNAKG
jgi:hypothetical protein